MVFSTLAAEINVVTSDAKRCSMASLRARLNAPCMAGNSASINNTANNVAANINRTRSERIIDSAQ